jgi:hypothetical protein|tara:strand:+ start:2871 stop:3911 length:1041 start_codon:yes stop_codon:yes gene_type:complete
MTYFPFTDANDVGDRFLALLGRYGINPPPGSNLEEELLSLTQLLHVFSNPNIAPDDTLVELHRAAAGVADFAAKILSVQEISEFDRFLPHLQLIAETKLKTASFGQNSAGAYNDDTSRKMAELYMGCLVAHLSQSVDLDSPTAAKGDNPDVIFETVPKTIPLRKEIWAFAIKTISSQSGQTIFERIREGAKQIECCRADSGMVLINTKDALDHDKLAASPYAKIDDALVDLKQQIVDLAERANEHRPQSEWDDLFLSKVKRPVLFLGQSMAYISDAGGRTVPMPLRMLLAYDANGQADPHAMGLATQLNWLMQEIRHGRLENHNGQWKPEEVPVDVPVLSPGETPN